MALRLIKKLVQMIILSAIYQVIMQWNLLCPQDCFIPGMVAIGLVVLEIIFLIIYFYLPLAKNVALH